MILDTKDYCCTGGTHCARDTVRPGCFSVIVSSANLARQPGKDQHFDSVIFKVRWLEQIVHVLMLLACSLVSYALALQCRS